MSSNPFDLYSGYLPAELKIALKSEVDPSGDVADADVDDASTTVKGVVKLSAAPASATNPIAVGDNDDRMTDDRTASGLRSATTVVAVDAATAPSAGQVLTASDSETATWETPVKLDAAQTFTAAQGVAAVALSDGANITTDASLGNVFTVTLGGNRTLDNPTNLVSGFTYIWVVTQDATGSRTLAYGNAFKWPGGAAPTLTTAAGSVDVITAIYNGTSLLCVSQLNFS